MTITAVNYAEGTFAGTYGMINSATDELRGTFDKDGGNLVGWTISYRNSYVYGTQVWSGHFVDNQGTSQLAIESLSIRTGPGYNPAYIMSEYFVQAHESGYATSVTNFSQRLSFHTVVPGQVWTNAQKDVITILKVDSENGTFAGKFKRARDKTAGNEYNIRGELGKDGSSLGWSVIYIYEDPQKLDYRNCIVWCGHTNINPSSQKQEIYTMWLNTTEYKQLQNYIVTNVGFDKFVVKSNGTNSKI